MKDFNKKSLKVKMVESHNKIYDLRKKQEKDELKHAEYMRNYRLKKRLDNYLKENMLKYHELCNLHFLIDKKMSHLNEGWIKLDLDRIDLEKFKKELDEREQSLRIRELKLSNQLSKLENNSDSDLDRLYEFKNLVRNNKNI